MRKARAFVGVGIAVVLWLALLAACQTAGEKPDDSDADRSEFQEEQDDLCQGGAVDCSPGQCRVVDGRAQCDCPESYVADRYTCRRTEDGDQDTERINEPDLDEVADQQEEVAEEEEAPAVIKTFSHPASRDDPLLQPGEVRITAPGKVASAPFISYDVLGNKAVYCTAEGNLYICNMEQSEAACYLFDITQNQTDCFFPSIPRENTVAALTYIVNPDNSVKRHLMLLDFLDCNVSFPVAAEYLYNIDTWENIAVWDNENRGIQVFNTTTEELYVIEESEYWFNSFPRIYKQNIVWKWSTSFSSSLAYIFMHDLTTRSTKNLTPDSEARRCDPAITDRRAVWIENCLTYSSADEKEILVAQDLLSNERTEIDPFDADKNTPDIDEDHVVWTDLRNGGRDSNLTFINADIYLYDFAKDTVVQLTTDSSNQFWPRIRGRWVIYNDARWGDEDVTAFDLCILDIYKDEPMCAAEKK
ncbi:MAG: hypothetical protein C4523_03755 [Myxococcales bacterium]|nr:MAG: hypothetical protein C4523_03755 [Myxococcales bacterium]